MKKIVVILAAFIGSTVLLAQKPTYDNMLLSIDDFMYPAGSTVHAKYMGITPDMFGKFYIAIFTEGEDKPITKVYTLTKSSGTVDLQLPEKLKYKEAKCIVKLFNTPKDPDESFWLDVYLLFTEDRDNLVTGPDFHNKNISKISNGQRTNSWSKYDDFIIFKDKHKKEKEEKKKEKAKVDIEIDESKLDKRLDSALSSSRVVIARYIEGKERLTYHNYDIWQKLGLIEIFDTGKYGSCMSQNDNSKIYRIELTDEGKKYNIPKEQWENFMIKGEMERIYESYYAGVPGAIKGPEMNGSCEFATAGETYNIAAFNTSKIKQSLLKK